MKIRNLLVLCLFVLFLGCGPGTPPVPQPTQEPTQEVTPETPEPAPEPAPEPTPEPAPEPPEPAVIEQPEPAVDPASLPTFTYTHTEKLANLGDTAPSQFWKVSYDFSLMDPRGETAILTRGGTQITGEIGTGVFSGEALFRDADGAIDPADPPEGLYYDNKQIARADHAASVQPEEPAPVEDTGPLVTMFGPLEIRVENIRHGRAAALHGDTLEAGTAAAMLMDVTVTNTSTDRTIRYQSWNEMTTFDLPVMIRDDLQSRYHHRQSGKSGLQPQAKPPVFIATITEKNLQAAKKPPQNPRPLVMLVTFTTCTMNGELKSLIQELARHWQGKVNFGIFETQGGEQENTYLHTKFTKELLDKYGIALPCVLVYDAKGEPAGGWPNNPGITVIDNLLANHVTPPQPGEPFAPGKTFTEQLAFDPPVVGAKTFTLELPTMAFGVKGQSVKFTFSKSRIQGEQE